jgi:hypothetical protein
MSLMTTYDMTHIAFRLATKRLEKFTRQKPQLDKTCPEEIQPRYKLFGVAGVIHDAFQEHDKKRRAITKLIDMNMQGALAQLGLDQLFSQTVAKVLNHEIFKEKRDSKWLKDMNSDHSVMPFGALIGAMNGVTLDLDQQPALYRAAWYEDPSRMAALDFLTKTPRFPSCDALTALLHQTLVGENLEDHRMLTTALVHMVLHIHKWVTGKGTTPLNNARILAISIDETFNGYYQAVTTPTIGFKDAVNVSRALILKDPMATRRIFGLAAVQRLKNRDPVLVATRAHKILPLPDALPSHNPTLPGCLAYTAQVGFQAGMRQLELEAPYVTAYLCLYMGLKASGIISSTHEDAEAPLSCFGEESFFGPAGRPQIVSAVLACLTALTKVDPERVFFPKIELDALVEECVLNEEAGAWESLCGF